MNSKTKTIIPYIMGAVVILFFIANVFNDANSEIEYVNEEYNGGKIIKIIGLIFSVGVVYMVYKFLIKK